ncbi:MAG: MFS transporter [Muribaculaceae bacterium]|nr:MFS transporter [Muribaculaceae bacterium]
MQIKTGKGPVTLMVVLAIWSLSLAVDLPGLAVTPIEGKLHTIFKDVTDFKIQLLTVLPNLIIIPFVLLSGKLSETTHKIALIVTGIICYALSGALSLFVSSLTILIWLSCLLGAGCGLILPFATGLIADVFTGAYRTKQMGIVSAIGNIALVGATFAVGFLAAKDWHLPFIVYLIPLVSLLLLPWLKKIPKQDLLEGATDSGVAVQPAQPSVQTSPQAATQPQGAQGQTQPVQSQQQSQPQGQPAQTVPLIDADGFSTQGQTVKWGFYIGRTIWLMVAYAFFEFACSLQTYYLPNLMPEYGMDVEKVSMVTSVFYFAMFIIGIFVTAVLRVLRRYTFIISTAAIVAGFLIYLFTKDFVLYVVAAGLAGLGNGQTQPIFYTKATELVTKGSKSTLALALLQAANYIGISLVPVIVNAFVFIFRDHSAIFPFILGTVFTAIALVIIILRRDHFVFGIHKAYFDSSAS